MAIKNTSNFLGGPCSPLGVAYKDFTCDIRVSVFASLPMVFLALLYEINSGRSLQRIGMVQASKIPLLLNNIEHKRRKGSYS